MNYLLDRRNKKKKIFKILGVAGVILFLFFFGSGIYLGFSKITAQIFRPFQFVGNSAIGGVAGMKAYFVSKKSLYEENEKLRNEIFMREVEMANHTAIVLENESLKEILGRVPENKKVLLAAILSKPNKSAYDTLVLDAGEKDGISIGDAVYAMGNIPLGRIEFVTLDTSRAVLFSSAGEKNPVIVPTSLSEGTHTDAFWEIVGRGGGNFEMILPRDFVLNKGDQVVLPGIRTYAVAIAETILSDPREAFKKALLKSPVNIQDLKFVQIEVIR